jgi:hypothetical protein
MTPNPLPDQSASARARAFAASIAERGYPHSGAIEAYDAEHVQGSDPETWRVGSVFVWFTPEGVFLSDRPAIDEGRDG